MSDLEEKTVEELETSAEELGEEKLSADSEDSEEIVAAEESVVGEAAVEQVDEVPENAELAAEDSEEAVVSEVSEVVDGELSEDDVISEVSEVVPEEAVASDSMEEAISEVSEVVPEEAVASDSMEEAISEVSEVVPEEAVAAEPMEEAISEVSEVVPEEAVAAEPMEEAISEVSEVVPEEAVAAEPMEEAISEVSEVVPEEAVAAEPMEEAISEVSEVIEEVAEAAGEEVAEEAVAEAAGEEVAEEAVAEEVVEEVPAEPEIPLETLPWDEQVERLVAMAEGKAGNEAVEDYVRALRLVDFNNPGDVQLAEVWTMALRAHPELAREIWIGASRVTTIDQEVWTQVASAHQITAEMLDGDALSAVTEALGWTEILRAGAQDSGKAHLGTQEAGSRSAAILDAMAIVATGNWRKVEQSVDGYLKAQGLAGEAYDSELAHWISDLSIGASATDRAVEILRRTTRKVTTDLGLKWRLALLYRDTKKWNAYVDVLSKDLVNNVEAVHEKVAIYREMIRIYSTEMNQDMMVVKTYEALLGVDPENAEALEKLVEIYERMRRWPDLVNLLVKQADASEGERKVELLLRVAKVYLEKLSRKVDAIKYFELVLEVDSTHEESLEQLKVLYTERRDWEKLINVHWKELGRIESVEDQVTLLKSMADIAKTKMRNNGVAISVWEEVLKRVNDDPEALGALEALYEGEKRWADLARICEIRTDLEPDSGERFKMWQRIGLLYSDRINDNSGAIRAWRKVLEIEPSYPKGIDSLRKLLIEERDWESLEAFYAERDLHADLVKLFESLSGSLSEQADVKAVLLRAAHVYENALNDSDNAIATLEKILSIDPSDASVASELVGYYEPRKEWEKLSAMLEILYKAALGDIEESSAYGLRLARLFEQKLSSHDRAYKWYYTTVSSNPLYDVAYDELEKCSGVVGKAQEVVDLYTKTLETVDDAGRYRDLRFRIGHLLLEYLNRADDAQAIFEELLEQDPEDIRALGALENILEREGKFEELLAVNAKRMDLAKTPAEEAETLLSGARIYEKHLNDKERTIQSYERVCELLPEDDRALIELHRLYREVESYELLARTIEKRLVLLGANDAFSESALEGEVDEEGLVGIMYGCRLVRAEDGSVTWYNRVCDGLDPDVVIPLWMELGQVYQNELAEYEAAVSCYENVLTLDVTHEGAKEAMESLLESGVSVSTVAASLARVYATNEDYASLVKALGYSAEGASDVRDKMSYLLCAARIECELLENVEASFDLYARALQLNPASVVILSELQGIAENNDSWARLVSIYEEVELMLEGDKPLRTVYDLRLSECYEVKLADNDRAIEYARKALQNGKEDAEVLAVLQDTFIRLESWADVISVLEAKSALTEDEEEQLSLSMQIAGIREEYLDQKSEAIDTYLSVLDRVPDNMAALEALERLYAATERWEEAASNYERRIELLEDEADKDVVRCHLASVLSAKLGEEDRAIEIYHGVLLNDPTNALAVEGLETMIASIEGSAVETISEMLLPIYDQLGEWEKRAWVDEQLLRVVLEPDRRRELLHEIGQLYATNSMEHEKSFDAYARSLKEDLTCEETIQQLFNYAEGLDKWGELVEVMGEATKDADDAEASKRIQVMMAQIYQEHLDDIEGATRTYEAIREMDPEDVDILNALEMVYREQSSWQKLAEVLCAKAHLSMDSDERKSLLFQAASIYEEVLNEVDSAIAIHNEILTDEAGEPTALDCLERLYTGQERWEDLLNVLNSKIEGAEDEETQKALFYQLGALQVGQLADNVGAVETYRQVLNIDANDAHALEALDHLFLAGEDWVNLLEILERREEIAEDEESRVVLKFRQAEVWYRNLTDVARSIEVYKSVLEMMPSHEGAIAALEEIIASGSEYAVDAARVLEPVYRGLERWVELVAVYEVLVKFADDVEELIQLLGTIGTIEEELLGDQKAAFNAWYRALTKDASREETWEVVERLAAACECWEELVNRCDELLMEVSSDAQVGIIVATHMARIYEAELGNPEKAIEMLRRVIDFDSNEINAIKSLDRLYESQEMWQELADILHTEIDLAEEDTERLTCYYRLGMVHESQLDNVDDAIASFNEMLMIVPGQPDAIEALVNMFNAGRGVFAIAEILEPYYRETEQWENLVALDLLLIEHIEDSNDRYDKLLEVAEIYLEYLQQIPEGLDIYGRALCERPGDEFCLNKIVELCDVLQSWDNAVVYYKNAVAACDDDIIKQDLMLRKAQTYDEKLEDYENAERCYLAVLGYDPEHLVSLEALDRIYLARQRWTDLVPIIRREIDCVSDDMQRVNLYMRLGAILSEMLNDPRGGIEAYHEILSIEPGYMDALTALEAIHTQLEEWPELYSVYEQEAEVCDDVEARVDFWARMANLASEILGKPDDAIDLWYQSIDAVGDNLRSLCSLEVLFVRAERWADAADVIDRQIPLYEPGTAELLETFRKLGRMWRDQLDDIERSLEYWRRALEVSPTDLETLRAIQAIDEGLNDYEDLVSILGQILQSNQLGLEDQIACAVHMAQTQSNELFRIDDAIATWHYVLQLDATHELASSELERLYTEQERWPEVVNTLDARSEVVDDIEGKINLRLQIASVWEEKENNIENAAQAYQKILEIDPARDSAFTLLEELYTKNECWQELFSAYVERSDVVPDPKARLEILLKASKVAEEKLENLESAFVVLHAAIPESWKDETLHSELERLADANNAWQDMVEIYEGLIEQTADSADSLVLHNTIANWYFHKLGDNELSWNHFEYVLSIEPNNMEALSSLTVIFQRLGNWEELVNNLTHRIDLSTQVDDRVSLFMELGNVWETKYNDPEKGIEAYTQAYRLNPERVDVMKELARVYEERGNWNELVSILEKESAVVTDTEESVAVRFKIAEVWEKQLGNNENAVNSYLQVIPLDESHKETLLALERLLTILGRWKELLEIYDYQLRAFTEPEEQISIYFKVSQIYENNLDDIDNAINSMRQVTLIDSYNTDAIEQLERMYEQHERWNDLVEVLTTHISVLSNPEDHVELYRKLGEVFRDKQNDAYRAVESYQALIGIHPEDIPALMALAELYEKGEDYISAIDVLNRVVACQQDDAEKVNVLHRIGTIYVNYLGDDTTAEERFQSALSIDMGFMPAIDSLKSVYENREDWKNVIRMLKQKIEYTRELDLKAQLYCDLGNVAQYRLNDMFNAYAYYEEALKLLPSHVESARPLAEKCMEEGNWARALLLYEIILQGEAFRADCDDLYLLNYKAGYACQQLAQDEKALQFFRSSYELNQGYYPTLIGMGQQLMVEKDYERAFNMFRTVLENYMDSLTTEQVIQVYYDSAVIKKETGDYTLSRQLLEHILEADADHTKALETVIEVCAAMEDWEAVVYYESFHMERQTDESAKFNEILKIADVFKNHIDDPVRLVETYQKALEINPESKSVLSELLKIYFQHEQWENAIIILDRLASLESSPEKIARFYYTIATVYRDNLNDDDNAVEFFNRTLDENVNELRAFEAIDRILTALKDWRRLEHNYRKMIKRVLDNDEGQFGDTKQLLWYGLGEIYRTRLEEWDNAIAAFKKALELRPKNEKLHRILADLYIRMPSHEEDAIDEYRTLIKQAGEGAEREKLAEWYRALFVLYFKTGQYDRAWCVANITSTMGFAREDEIEFNERYLNEGLTIAQSKMGNDSWDIIRHPGHTQTAQLGVVLGYLSNARPAFALDLKNDWQMHPRKNLEKPDQDKFFWKLYNYISSTLGCMQHFDVYTWFNQNIGMFKANVENNAYIIGQDMLSGRDQRDLAFIIARQLTLGIQSNYMAGLPSVPSEKLKKMIMAAVAISNDPNAVTADEDMQKVVKSIQKFNTMAKNELLQSLKPIKEGKIDVNTSHWLKGVDYTANRVALLFCGDLKTALRSIHGGEQYPVSKLTVAEREADLISFALSDEYFELRSRLGLAVE